MTRDPAHMLRSAVSVRRRERRYATGDARREGVAGGAAGSAQADFGARLIDRVKGD